MIAFIIRWSVENRALVVLASLILFGLGLYSLQHTAVDAIPDLSDTQVIVKTHYPGQAPQVVQDQITYPMTTTLLSVPGAKTVRGFSFYGDSFIYVIFDDNTDLYWARSRVQEYLSQAAQSLPEGVKPQLGPDASGVGWVFIYALIDKTGQHDLSELRSIQDWFLKFELKTVAGVAEVATVGGMVKQYQVVAHPEKLRAFNIPLTHLHSAIQQANQEVGASVIEMAEAEYMVRVSGYIKSIADLELIPLGTNHLGTPLYLKDVADIRLGPKMRRGIAELNGEGETVGGIIVMRHGENAQQTIAAVKNKLQELKKSLPQGVELVTVYDRSQLIQRAVRNLWQTLGEELLVVSLVCVLFLFHLRSSLVVIISLPMGVLLAFIIMRWQGIDANIMSLGGIAIAIGAMIDGAMVMIENVQRRSITAEKNTAQYWEAIIKSAQEVGPAIFFSLLIIAVSFLPVFMLEAQEGRMFHPLAYTKTYAMLAAAMLTITLVPVLTGWFASKTHRARKQKTSHPATVFYQKILTTLIQAPKRVLVIFLILGLSTIWPAKHLSTEFMPDLDEGDLMYMPTTYPGLSIGKARELLQQSDKLIATVPEVASVFGKVGRAESATDPAPLTMIESFIRLKPREAWRPGMTLEKLKAELNALTQFPGVSNAWVMPIKTRIDMLTTGVKTPLGIKISGADLQVIQNLNIQLEQILQALNTEASIYSERVSGGRYLNIELNRQASARYQLSIAEAQQLIAMAVGGQELGQSVEGLQRYPINLRYPQAYRNSPEALASLPIVTSKGAHITLADIARITITQGPPVIKSENARLAGWTLIDLNEGDVETFVAQANIAIEQQLRLPAGYSLSWSGQHENTLRVKEKLRYMLPLNLLIIVILLYWYFRSFAEVALILSTLPFALVGSIWLMHLTGFKLSVASAVGMIALAGVAIEIGVIMLAYLNQAYQQLLLEAKPPLLARQLILAITAGASTRLRPILMTSTATTVGLIPVVLGSGTGSELMQSLAIPMIGGMLSTLVLSLFLLPTLYFYWKQNFRWSSKSKVTKTTDA